MSLYFTFSSISSNSKSSQICVHSKVDSNPAYDNLTERGQDAEDQYFDEDDSSNSEMQVDIVRSRQISNSSTGDELEEFMNDLRPEIMMQDINSKMKHL